MQQVVRDAIARGMAPIRRRQPYVIWGNEPMNGGNFLFLWVTAWARQRSTGVSWLVRYKPKMEPWLQEFPRLRELTVTEDKVSFFQPRTVEWGHEINVDFLYPDLKQFCRDMLLHGSAFSERWGSVTPGATVVNMRRGDYYSNPEFRRHYGFDVREFVRAAIEEIDSPGGAPVVFVSDDPDWCVTHLSDLFAGGDVRVMPSPHDMFQDLAQVSSAENLILANSTFSYWGGYLASSRPPGQRPRRVVAPLFFGRHYPYSESALLLPEWLAVPGDRYGEGSA